jgi:hypothetical protein
MAMDATRNLVYISAKANQVVRVVDVAQNKIIAVYGTFSTSAGASYSGDGGPASSATMYQPLGLAVDTVNNLLYVADSSNRVIRVINVTSNIINTFAGDYYYGDTRLAVNARLTLAHKMAIDSVNNLVYIADTAAFVVRVVNRTSGIISTFAGTPGVVGGYSTRGDGGLATSAKLGSPRGIAVDTGNNLVYIVDNSVFVVRVVNRTSGIISTFAGKGSVSGSIGDGSPATNAILYFPSSVALDTVNNLIYISEEQGNRIRVVDRATGYISTLVGDTSTIAAASGSSGDKGPPSAALLYSPQDVKVDSVNNMVYIAESYNTRIRVVNRTSNIIDTLVSGIGKPESYGSVYSISVDPINKLLYYTDATNHVVRSVCLNNINITNTFAGINGSLGYSGDYGNAADAMLNQPVGVAVDALNKLVYISEYRNMVVRVVRRTSIPSCTLSDSPTPTPTNTPTPSPTPTETPTPTLTATPTNTPTPSLTPTNTLPTPAPTNAPTPSSTPTDTPTPTPTYTPPTLTATPTSTPTVTPTSSPTSTPVLTSSLTPTPTQTLTSTPTPTPTQTNTPTPTPTSASTLPPTPTPQIQCFNIPASNTQVCSGNGACISTDNCQCSSPTIIGSKCEVNMEAHSSSYIAFDTNSRQSSINIDATNELPNSSGPASYTFTSDNQLQISSSSSDTGRNGICLNPSVLIAGLQTFVAFSFPVALPSGVACEIWLQDANDDYQISSALRFVGGLQSLALIADSTTSTTMSLNANETYVILLSVSSFGSDVSSQVITLVSIYSIMTYNQKNNIITTASTPIYDASLANALTSDAFLFCFFF